MGTDTIDSVLAVLTKEPGLDSYLVYVDPRGKLFAGRYRFPGEKLQQGEDCFQALKRGLPEEFDVKVSDVELLYKKGNVLGGELYLCSGLIDGIPTRKEQDVGEPEWMSASDLFRSNLVPNCKLALYVHLLRTQADTLYGLFYDIEQDQKFVEHLKI
ncbi:MAG: NUDIX domain-containing protein [archaeon]|nr:hypothetical protein [Nanoarchaeota archaeon]